MGICNSFVRNDHQIQITLFIIHSCVLLYFTIISLFEVGRHGGGGGGGGGVVGGERESANIYPTDFSISNSTSTSIPYSVGRCCSAHHVCMFHPKWRPEKPISQQKILNIFNKFFLLKFN